MRWYSVCSTHKASSSCGMDATAPLIQQAAVHGALPDVLMDAEDRNPSTCTGGDGGSKRRRERRPRDPNRARTGLQRELEKLRSQVNTLQQTLSTLQNARQHVENSALMLVEVGGDDDEFLGGVFREREASVWREVAERQIQHCVVAENENLRLQKLVRSQQSHILRLKQLCFGRATAKVSMVFLRVH